MEANGLYPRIIGIGCQKCGTGALAVYLASLRNFHKPVTKEIHAFRGDRVFTQVAKDPVTAGPNALVRSLEWYGREWNVSAGLSIHCDAGPPVRCRGNAEPGHVPFEITPRYLSDLRVPYNMQQQLPHIAGVKLVVILRHPTPRAWSAFFQTARPPMWRRDTFVDHVREEVRLLRRCYNSSMAFALLAADTMGHRPTRLGADHIRATACREPIAAYRALQRCVQAHVRDPDEAWFLKYSQAYSEMPRQFGVLEEAPFQGNVVRGFYVDNFVNLLCAGFRPEDVLVLTQGKRQAGSGLRGGRFVVIIFVVYCIVFLANMAVLFLFVYLKQTYYTISRGSSPLSFLVSLRFFLALTPAFPMVPSGELRANATHVAERVAHHAGVPFEIAEPKWFTQGVSKQHKSVGTIPEEVVPLLNELYAPYNDMLLKLLLSNAFPMDRLAVLREFGEYVPPPPPPPAELAEINDEMNAAAEAASLKAEERLRQSEKQRKGSREVASNKKPKARNVPVPDI